MKWFKHYSNAHDNNDLTKVRMKFGAEGYAIYWYCLELIAGDLGAEKAINFELKHDAEVIGFNLKIDSARVEEIMRFMAGLGLFENSGGVITCLKLAKYLDKKTTRNSTIHAIIDAASVSGDVPETSGSVPDMSGTVPERPEVSPLDTDRDTDSNKKINGIFAHWRKTFEHPDAVLDDVRRELIAKWLAQGYTAEQLVKAINGCRKTPWNMGENDAGTVFDDLTLIFESAKQIDRFIAHDDKPPQPKQKPARQGGGKGWTYTIAGETVFLPWNDGNHDREYSALQRKYGIDLRGLARKAGEDKMRRKLSELEECR